MDFVAKFFDGLYFDGLSAKPHPIKLSAQSGVLQITDESGEITHIAAHDWRTSEPFQHAPRIISLPQGHIEVPESPDLCEWLTTQGRGMSWVERAQWSWRRAALALVLLIGVLVSAYRWGLPALASALAPLVPQSYLAKLDTEALAQIDQHWTKPSQLSLDTQNRIREKFLTLQPIDDARGFKPSDLKVVFRSSRFGPNAVALPGGTFVVFDELVQIAPSDDAVVGVMAHEWAHVARRHAMRGLAQNAAVGVFFSVYIGDVSGVMATVGSTLGFLHYSRGFETEADTFAIATLKANNLSGEPLAVLFERMMNYGQIKACEQYKNEVANKEKCERETTRATESNEVVPEFLSSHPATAERIARFRTMK